MGTLGDFFCVVQNAYFGAYVAHNLNIECESRVVLHLL